ncbi:tetratricopeptide repeat-containing sensor histidine kinase [Psychroserpens sp.]
MKLPHYSLFFVSILLSFQSVIAQNIDSLTIKAISGSDKERLNALDKLGDYYFYSQPSKSDSVYRLALKLSRQSKNEKEECKFLSYIGMSFNEKAQADSILYYQNKSLVIALKLQDSSYIASAYGNIGNAYVIKEKQDIAIEYYNKALAIFEAQNNVRMQAIVSATFARIYMDLTDYNQAISYNKKARIIFNNLKALHPYTSSTINIGICNQRLNNYDKAKQYLEEGKSLAEENDFKRLLRVATLQLGNIHFEHFKDYEKAKGQYKQTESLSILFGDAEGIARANLKLGKIASIQNRNKEAIKHFRIAAENYKKIGAKTSYSSSLSYLIETLKKSDRRTEAFPYYEELIALNDSIYDEKSKMKSLELLTEFDVSQKNKEIEIQSLKLKQQALDITKQRNTKIFFLVLSSLLLILLYFVWRTNKYKKLNQHHKIKSKRFELEQRLLRSQMNPHFIFNALNSIQSYVSENKTMDSEIYLSRFSHLMRQILEHSQEEFIILKDDINALDAYLNLEQLRFEDSFNFRFETNDIDESKVMIPPMLLQPFVENAILHGLEPKKSEGLIGINIKIKKTIQSNMTYGVLICNIIDNGIGRDAAAKKDNSPNREHVSLALKLIKERLASYSEITNETYNIQIEDLYENTIASGTKIIIEMPYTQDLL